jgi:hypothetical protein
VKEVVIKKDVFGAILENLVNTSPISGGVHRKARYSPHQGRMEMVTEQVNRLAILGENAELYKANKGRYGYRKDLAGGVPLRIPEQDYNELYKDNVWLNHCDRQTKAKFFMKLYREHPEYRIG